MKTVRKHHEIWIEQCEAARQIKNRYGLQAAFDYIVGEKLLNYAEAALKHQEFARALPGFLSEVRGMFTPAEIRTNLAWLEQEICAPNDKDDNDEIDDILRENPATRNAQIQRFRIVQELLTAQSLGTS